MIEGVLALLEIPSLDVGDEFSIPGVGIPAEKLEPWMPIPPPGVAMAEPGVLGFVGKEEGAMEGGIVVPKVEMSISSVSSHCEAL